jgi:hypothetical protein
LATCAIAVAAVGVFLTWTSGTARLDGTQSPNNGWLVAIVGAFALGWIRAMARGSWMGVAGVLGASAVMFWTGLENWLDNRDVLGGTAGLGIVLVLGGAVALRASAVVRGVHMARHRARRLTAST